MSPKIGSWCSERIYAIILKFQNIAFFIYQPKYLDLGKPEVIEVFSNKLEQSQIKEIADHIQVVKKQNLLTETLDEDIKQWLAKFILSYQDKLSTNYAEWERRLMLKIKMELQFRGQQGFWHIYFSNRLDYVIDDLEDCNMLFEIDFGGFSKFKSKKKLLIFQKKGFAESIFGMWKTKVPELMGFTGMLLMFIAVAFCKGSRILTGATEELQYSHISGDLIKSEMNRNLSTREHYSLILYAGAVLFFSYLGNKMLGKYRERGEKMKQIRAMKKE
eukprot:CAMPEP_0176475666 /NCGR_PEP_ID=MMETSP0127-20121128/43729_1 /TAXON_ID=938130 /ORGANISM="Platyophrya macrostoma, Strain WH" /LENGTH=273 /DNA_ID=CAMNT_0017871279 /DNA_START=169 /DNA_END=990 /DNA_ORIENTATION=+